MSRKMTINRVRCGSCLAVLESRSEHDQQICYCGDVAVSGGFKYQHLVLSQSAVYQDMSEFEEVPDASDT